jgi:hypothetical protein
MDFKDCVQVITQIVTALTAVVMAVLAYFAYLQPAEQSQESEPDEASDDSASEELNEILVFKTSKQETWLSVLPQGLHCRIKDDRPNKGGPQWTLSRTQAKEILNSGTFHINPGYKVKTGTFTLGPRRNWLYTKSLFPEPEYLHGILKQLLVNSSS